jgi:beta-galactosidase
MKIRNNFILLILILSASLSVNAREIVSFNSNWKFCLGDPENAQTVDFDDSGWTDISIPHDWAVSGPFYHNLPANTGKLPWKGTADLFII